MGECSESAGKVATGRVTLFSQTFHWAHKLELLHCHFWYCYNYSWNYHSIARKNWMLVTSVVLRFNINLKWDRKSSQSYNAYFFFFFRTVFPCNIMKLLCNHSYCSHSDILSKKLSFFSNRRLTRPC